MNVILKWVQNNYVTLNPYISLREPVNLYHNCSYLINVYKESHEHWIALLLKVKRKMICSKNSAIIIT